MENFSKMRLEYLKMENNLSTHKRGANPHTINKQMLEDSYKAYLMFQSSKLLELNIQFDDMGFGDLENYEKWLVNVRDKY